MSVPKGKRNESKDKYDALYYTIFDDAIRIQHSCFYANKNEIESNIDFIANAQNKLNGYIWDLIVHIKTAKYIYPTTKEEYVERRIEQEKAIGICHSILTLYELTMRQLKAKDDAGVIEIQNIRHQINALKAWRSADNKQFRHFAEQVKF